MRQLRYLRPGDDGNHVILENADGSEQYVLYVTVPLRDAIRVDLPKLTTGPTTSPEEGISPREIQVRVRAGADPEALATASNMTLERVLRFAGPVLEERVRIADTARRGRARSSASEGQTVIFGEAVDTGFVHNGIDPFTVRWDAYRRLDGQWVVTAKWDVDETEYSAEWAFHLNARNVTPIDETSADLLNDRPLRVLAVPEPEPDPAVSTVSSLREISDISDRGADTPQLAPGVVAFPRLAAAPLVTDARDAADSAPADHMVEEVFDHAVLDDFNDFGGVESVNGVEVVDAVDGGDVDTDPRHIGDEPDFEPVSGDDYAAPHLPLRLAESPQQAGTEPQQPEGERSNTKPLPRLRNLGVAAREEEKVPARPKANQRPKVPAWDDIVLGVRRPTE
jgi:hypothetical protein